MFGGDRISRNNPDWIHTETNYTHERELQKDNLIFSKQGTTPLKI